MTLDQLAIGEIEIGIPIQHQGARLKVALGQLESSCGSQKLLPFERVLDVNVKVGTIAQGVLDLGSQVTDTQDEASQRLDCGEAGSGFQERSERRSAPVPWAGLATLSAAACRAPPAKMTTGIWLGAFEITGCLAPSYNWKDVGARRSA